LTGESVQVPHADQIHGFLDAVALPSGPTALLHIEVRREHLLVAEGPGDGRFAGPDADRYGYRPDELGPELRLRPLAWGILHRYGNPQGGCGGCASRLPLVIAALVTVTGARRAAFPSLRTPRDATC
jgi:hypothetical protein